MEKIKKWIKRFLDWVVGPEVIPTATFVIYKGKGNVTRWKLVDGDGDVRGRCPGNPNVDKDVTEVFLRCLREKLPNLETVPPLEWYFEYYQGRNDKYYWRLIHQRKKQIDYIAIGGEGFETQNEVIEDIEKFKELGFIANITGPETKEDSCTETKLTTDQET